MIDGLIKQIRDLGSAMKYKNYLTNPPTENSDVELITRLSQNAGYAWGRVDELTAENIRLKARLAATESNLRRRTRQLYTLDAEYGEIESAIIMADPDFDGDSNHANCKERLLDSIKRLQCPAAPTGETP